KILFSPRKCVKSAYQMATHSLTSSETALSLTPTPTTTPVARHSMSLIKILHFIYVPRTLCITASAFIIFRCALGNIKTLADSCGKDWLAIRPRQDKTKGYRGSRSSLTLQLV
ncbi:unnamed protein product, partial [Ceratitis capitata]